MTVSETTILNDNCKNFLNEQCTNNPHLRKNGLSKKNYALLAGFVSFELRTKNKPMFDKIFKWAKRTNDPALENERGIQFGRYSDNNKSTAKVNRWTVADNLFKEKKISDSIESFFEYLKDDDLSNVSYRRNGDEASFELYQGSKVVRGRIEGGKLTAEVKLVKMPQPSVPVMRRLLEMNFGLFYTRYALKEDELYMRFDTNLETANPSKLYYGLKELATKSDKQDDLLVQDFSSLQDIDNDHIIEIPESEKEVKFNALQNWISETLEKIASVDADKFSGGISYLLLTLVFRIDFLISPEGQTLNDLEKISNIYFKKDERPTVDKNRDMIEAFKKLKEKTKDLIFRDLFRSKYTFSIVSPQVHKTLADTIHEANENMLWYRDNSHEYFANKLTEYGLTYSQFTYSLPKPITEFIKIFMQVNYSDYFSELGYKDVLYKPDTIYFHQGIIEQRINKIQKEWKTKYPYMNFRISNLNYTKLLNFNHSFTREIEMLNMDIPVK